MTKPPDLALGSSWNPQRMFFRLAAGHCFNFLRAINKHRNPDFSSPDADFRMKLSKTAGEPGISLFHLRGTGNRMEGCTCPKLHRKDRKGREIRLRLICRVFSGIRHSLLVPKFCNWRRKNLPFQRSLTQLTVPNGIPETELPTSARHRKKIKARRQHSLFLWKSFAGPICRFISERCTDNRSKILIGKKI